MALKAAKSLEGDCTEKTAWQDFREKQGVAKLAEWLTLILVPLDL
jgi:hypothetical protein